MTVFTILELRRGCAEPFGPKGQRSAINKCAIDGPVKVTADGLVGDEQADRRHHGGPDKALHAYARCHYPAWIGDLPGREEYFRPGAFGENLVVDGVAEQGLCLGDQFQVGPVCLELAQIRQPCWKLNVKFALPDMARRVQSTGRTGWYFRVLARGTLTAGDQAQLVERPYPEWPLVRVWRLLYHNTRDRLALTALLKLNCLPDNVRRLAEHRVRLNRVEDWSARIDTP